MRALEFLSARLPLLNGLLILISVMVVFVALLPETAPDAEPDEISLQSIADFETEPLSLESVSAAPLFSPDRLPTPKRETDTTAVHAPPPQITGTVLAGNQRFLIALDGTSGKQRYYQVGDEVDGWMVARITSGEIILKSQEETKVIPIKPRNNGAAPLEQAGIDP